MELSIDVCSVAFGKRCVRGKGITYDDPEGILSPQFGKRQRLQTPEPIWDGMSAPPQVENLGQVSSPCSISMPLSMD